MPAKYFIHKVQMLKRQWLTAYTGKIMYSDISNLYIHNFKKKTHTNKYLIFTKQKKNVNERQK